MAAVDTLGLVGPASLWLKLPAQLAPGIQEPYHFEASYPNRYQALAGSPTEALAVANNLPIEVLPRESVAGSRMPTFLDDYYYRVHIRPGVVALGNLLSTQVREVEVWSAHFEPQLLASVGASGTDGINLTQPQVAPTYFAALEARTYILNVSTNGSPVIDARYEFQFPTESPALTVTGRRVVVWPFMPQTKHREGLDWQTDIIPTFKKEQRLALRQAPRQSLKYEFQLDNYQFSKAKAIATQWAHRVYGVPIWAELTRLGPLPAGTEWLFLDTTAADYRANDILLLWEDDVNNWAVETLEVLPDRIRLRLPTEVSMMNAYVAPLRFARTFSGMQFKRGAIDMVEVSATFEVTQNVDLGGPIGLPVYRGKDVLNIPTVLVGDMSEKILRAVDEFDNGSGPVLVDIRNDWVRSTKSATFTPQSREERWLVRRWIHSRRGRQKAFWIPSWNQDLFVLEDVGPAGASLTIRPIGFPLYYGVKDIMIRLLNGTEIYSRVLGSGLDPARNEVLSLDGPVGTGFAVADIERVSIMSHVRFDSDRLEISHGYGGQSSMSVPIVETPE